MSWQELCDRKKAQRAARIPDAWKIPASPQGPNLLDVPKTCGILSSRELEITETHDAVDLLHAIANGQYSSEEVTIAFCKRAAIAQQVVNCLTEICFDDAIQQARRLDEERLAHPEAPLRPFHGLPISIKDSFKINGFDSTIGMSCFIDKPATTEAALVTYLRSLGAIIYCKTNVPQTMMTADSDNNVFGRTLNPNNTNLTAGGSTGGEGALIALRGSILGVGTDVAGSIRIPSVCNGTYGFKPSAQIVPYGGQQSPVLAGLPGIIPSAGPLATSARACRYFVETIMSNNAPSFDVTCVNLRWAGVNPPDRPLRIGVLENDGVYTPTPPVRRGLSESVDKLKAAGMECIPVTIDGIGEIMNDIWDLFSLDGAKFTRSLIASSGEPLAPSVAMTGLVATKSKDIEQVAGLLGRQFLARKRVHEMFASLDLDCILTAPAPHTATPLDTWTAITYTSTFNYLDLPCLVIPVGTVKETDRPDTIQPLSEKDHKTYQLYSSAEYYANAPIAVQLIGRRQHDEQLLSFSERIDDILCR